jgi:hypothetical protein
VSVALVNLAPTSQAPWSPLLADIKLLTDQSGRDSRDAAALSRSLRERVGNPMSELAQKFAATRAQLLFARSELEALDVPQARGAPRQEALVVIGGGGEGAGERPRPLSEAVSVTRQSPPIFASTAVGPRACSPRKRNTLYASCPGDAGFLFVVPERMIEVEVEGAAHLPSMHLWTSASCQLELASSVLNHQQVQRTHVVERSCEPKWRRTLRLAAMCLQSDMLRASVLHEGSANMREVIGEVVRGEFGQALVHLSFHMALPPQRMLPLHGSVSLFGARDWASQPLLLQGLILICPTDQEANEAWLTKLKAATATTLLVLKPPPISSIPHPQRPKLQETKIKE